MLTPSSLIFFLIYDYETCVDGEISCTKTLNPYRDNRIHQPFPDSFSNYFYFFIYLRLPITVHFYVRKV